MGEGMSFKGLADTFGLSVPHSRYLVKKFINAVLQCDELDFKLPTTRDELERSASEWNSKSSAAGVYHGCVGALDGWLQTTQKPNLSNAADYRNGHYQMFGNNCQAVCDVHLRFIYFCVAGGGKMNDSKAIGRCFQFQQWLKDLPEEFFIVADNAYPLSNQCLTPFKGSQKNEVYNSSYNFHLSQLRIRIEMAFGRLTTKWRILRKKLDMGHEYNRKIAIVGALLHNYVVDNDGIRYDFVLVNDLSELDIEPLLDVGVTNNGFLPLRPIPQEDPRCTRREAIVAELRHRDIRRPIFLDNHTTLYDDDSDYEGGDDSE
jgi:hypothetical protein